MKNIFFLIIWISFSIFSAGIILSGCGSGAKTNPAGLLSYKAYTYTVGNGPTGIAVAPDGDIWVTNFYDNTVTELSSQGAILGTYTVGSGPTGIAVAPDGDIWVADTGTNSTISSYVTELSSQGTILGTYTTVGNGPTGIAVAPDGNIWVADIGNYVIGYSSVTELSPSGVVLGYTKYNSDTYGYGSKAIAVAPDGNIWVANWGTTTPTGSKDSSVTELSPSGTLIGTYITDGSGHTGIAVAPDGDIWVTNFYDNTITELSSQGAVMGVYTAGSGSEPNPVAIAIDPANGSIWISNWGMGNVVGNTVTELSSQGTILGTYTVGSGPTGIAVAPDGDIWIANENSNTVTELVKVANP